MLTGCDIHKSRRQTQDEVKSAMTKKTQTDGRVLFSDNKNVQNILFEWFSSGSSKSLSNISKLWEWRRDIFETAKKVKNWLTDSELMDVIKSLWTKPEDINAMKKVLQEAYRYTTAKDYSNWLSLSTRVFKKFQRIFNLWNKKEIDDMLLAHSKAVYFDEIFIWEQNLRNKLLEIKKRINEVEKDSSIDEIQFRDNISAVNDAIDKKLADDNLLEHLFKNSWTLSVALTENQTMSILKSLLWQKWVDLIQTKAFLWLSDTQLTAFKNLFWVADTSWGTVNDLLKQSYNLTRWIQKFARMSTFIGSFFSTASQLVQTKSQLRNLDRLWYLWINDELIDELYSIWWLQESVVFDGAINLKEEWEVITKLIWDYNSFSADIFKNWGNLERAFSSANKTLYSAIKGKSGNMGDFIDNFVNPIYQTSARNMALKQNNMDARSLIDIIKRMKAGDDAARIDYLKIYSDMDTFLETLTGFWNIRWMSNDKTWMMWMFNFIFWYQSAFGNSMLRNWLINASNLATAAAKNWYRVDKFIWEVLDNPALLYPVYQLLHSAKMAAFLTKLEDDSERENSSALGKALDLVQKMSIFYNAFAWIFSSGYWRIMFNWLRGTEMWEWYTAFVRQVGQETFREFWVISKALNAIGKIKNSDDAIKRWESMQDIIWEAIDAIFFTSAAFTMRWYVLDDDEFSSNFYKKNFLQNVIWLTNNVDNIRLKSDLSIARVNADINSSSLWFDASAGWKIMRAWKVMQWESLDPKVFSQTDSIILKNKILSWMVEWKQWREKDMRNAAKSRWQDWEFKKMIIDYMFAPEGKDILWQITNIPIEKRFDDIGLLRAAYIDNYGKEADLDSFLSNLWNSFDTNDNKLWMLAAAYGKKLWEKYNVGEDKIQYSYLWLLAMAEHTIKRIEAKWDLLIAPVDWKVQTNKWRVDYKMWDTIKKSELFDTKKELKANSILVDNGDGTMVPFADTSKETAITTKQKEDMKFALGMKLFKYMPYANSNLSAKFLVEYDKTILWKDGSQLERFQEWKIQQLIEVTTDLQRGKWISNAQISNLLDVGRIRDKTIWDAEWRDKFERQEKVALAKLSVADWIAEILPKLALDKEEITALKVKMFMENKDVIIAVTEDPVKYEKYKDIVKTALGNIFETSKEVNDMVDNYVADVQNWWTTDTWWGKWKKWPKLSLDDIKPFKDFASKNFKLLQTAYNETKSTQRKATAPQWRGFFQWIVKSDPAYSINPYWDLKTSTQTPIPTLKRASTRNKGSISRFSSIWKRTPKRKLPRTSSLTNSW